MQDYIPNQDLIRHLLKNYYGDEPNPPEEKYISSHWQHYSKLFDVDVDEQGNLISISGQAFGSLKWNGLVNRIIDQATVYSYLFHLPHRRDLLRLRAIASKLCGAMGLDPTFDVFRQVCSLDLLQSNLPEELQRKPMHILMIGDGYGVLSALLKQVFPNSTLVLVDLGKTLLFQAYYCQKAHPQYKHEIVSRVDKLDSLDYVYCPAEEIAKLETYKFDVAVNINSMQEMNNTTVASYFRFLRYHLYPNNLFYCCNRESKTLIGGEVSEILNYPWIGDDHYIIDDYCPWQKYYFSTAHSKEGVKLFGMRLPFVNLYDGNHLHRLAILSTD